MPQIHFEGRPYELREQETVLEGLLRHGAALRSGCRSGVCQSCLLRSVDATPPAAAQQGVKPSLKESGHFLACQCRPAQDMSVEFPGGEVLPWRPATVVAKAPLSGRVMGVTLRCPDGFTFRAGQFINLCYGERVRSYSIANVPDEGDTLQLHVYRIDDGVTSTWIHTGLASGERVDIQGPFGECVYEPAYRDQPLLLIGTGCGVAPLRGIIHNALRQDHQAPIHLFHGSRSMDGVYLSEEMWALSRAHPHFSYTPRLSDGSVPPGYTAGRAADVALARHPRLKDWRVYLCGNSAMVKSTKRRAFLAAAALQHIHADPFEFSPPST